MDWPLKIAVTVFSICLVVAIVLGLCMTWGLAFSQGMGQVLATVVLIGIGAGFYIAIRDSIQRITRK